MSRVPKGAGPKLRTANSMSRVPKIHVFLGAPAPPLEAVCEGEGEEPGPWTTTELCWDGARLAPREGGRGREGGGGAASEEPGRTLARTSDDPDGQRRDREIRISREQRQDDPPYAETSPVQHVQSDGDEEEEEEEEEEELCSESVQDYLDSCFPAGQPDPEPVSSSPDGSGPRSDPAVAASVSIGTEYLCAWTVSRALVLRGGWLGSQSGPSLDEAPRPPPPHTPTPDLDPTTPTPRPCVHTTTPDLSTPRLSVRPRPGSEEAPAPSTPPPPPRLTPPPPGSLSTSSPELYSPVAPSPSPSPAQPSPSPSPSPVQPASAELFYEPAAPSQRPGEGGVVLGEEGGVVLGEGGVVLGEEGGVVLGEGGVVLGEEGGVVLGEGGVVLGEEGGVVLGEGGVVLGEEGGVVLGEGGVVLEEEGGVVLEATPDGLLLCSQVRPREPAGGGAEPAPGSAPAGPPVRISPTAAPAPKRSRGASPNSSRTGRSTEVSVRQACVGRSPVPTTTPLARCSARGVRYRVLAAVVLPCHLKEVAVRRGAAAGTSVPLASVVVTDQSGADTAVVMWRRAAFWALTVRPGDVLLITGLKVNEDRWRGETVLQSTYTSTLLNLGQVTTSRSPPVPQNVNGATLRSLCSYLRERRPLLVSLPPRLPQALPPRLPQNGHALPHPQPLPHARLHALRPDTLVHALLRVTHTHMITEWRSEAEGTSRTGGTAKAVLSVEQGRGHQGALVLWGSALSWLTRINRNRDAVWEFRVLLVRESVTSGLPELHSTPWGSCEPLPPGDPRVLELHRPPATPSTSLEMDLRTLLSQKYTGDVELRVQITAFQFQGTPSQDAQRRLDEATPPEAVLEAVSGDVTFAGCGRCAAELDTDANGIYCPCYPCLPHTGVRRYYRPALLTVKEGESQVCVQVPSVLLQTILLDTPPDRLTRAVALGSEVRHAQLVADRLRLLLSLPRRTVVLTVRSHFLCDENSVVTAQDFLLLDLRSP